MQHRLDSLKRSARLDGPRVGLISTWDTENNAVRVLAATLRRAGFKCVEIYFKDWISNYIDPATDQQLDNLVRIIRREDLNLVCLSVRASAYEHASRLLTRKIHDEIGIPVMWGGMHATMAPESCLQDADLVLKGEGELPLLDLCIALRDGSDEVLGSKNCSFRLAPGEYVSNPLRPLVHDLDELAFRDYTSHDDKYFIYGKTYVKGDPQHGDPVFQMMGSRGCIYKCSYCYNSTYKNDIYPKQKWYRVRSAASMIDEIRQARSHWDFKRIRFDDEVFNFKMEWLEDFCERYPREVGLPFEIFIEPKLVNEQRFTMLRDAGLSGVYMGVQSSERVTGHLYDRRVKNQTIADIADLYHRLGIKAHFQLIYDDPVSTDEDKRALFEMISTFKHPYDIYLFSMTVFPGSELNNKLLSSGLISEYDIEGENIRTFYQHRINLEYPRPVEDTFWIALTQMHSKPFIPKTVLNALSRSEFLKKHPWPVIQMATGANYVKMGSVVANMVKNGEMTHTLLRRWLSTDRVITT